MLSKGIHVISSANGWAITVVGMLTVFLGLLGLFFLISQLHKIIILWDNKKGLLNNIFYIPSKKEPFPGYNRLRDVSTRIKEESRHAYILAKFAGEQFSISSLLELAKKRDISISNECIKILLEKSIIIPLKKDIYYWNE